VFCNLYSVQGYSVFCEFYASELCFSCIGIKRGGEGCEGGLLSVEEDEVRIQWEKWIQRYSIELDINQATIKIQQIRHTQKDHRTSIYDNVPVSTYKSVLKMAIRRITCVNLRNWRENIYIN
jgi:hypothetical protein